MGALIITAIALIAGIIEAKLTQQGKTKKEKCGFVLQVIVIIDGLSFLLARMIPSIKHFLDTSEYTSAKYIKLVILTIIISIAVCAVLALLEPKDSDSKGETKKRYVVIKAVFSVIFFIGACLLMGAAFVQTEWAQTQPEQLIINMVSPTVGTEFGIYLQGFEFVLIAFGLSGIFVIFCFKKLSLKIKSKQLITEAFKSTVAVITALAMITTAGYFAEHFLHISMLYTAYFVKSDFFEENYVDARDIKITFPEKKRNIIFFYLESIENTYLSKDLGGYMEENLMPELTELSYEGITFSDTSQKFGGPNQIFGTSWSLASMVNQSLGVTMNPPKSLNPYSDGNFYKGAYGLGDILSEQGYNQEIMIGSDARFGALNNLYIQHGNYKIFDYIYAKDNGYIPQDYNVWWGFEDDKLYEFAKEELTRLYEEGEPFNFTLEDADTHMPDGYLPPGAPTPYESPYANAIANSTKNVVEFIRWIQEQPFYENTTIIMIGDHLSMDVDFFKNIDSSYHRTQYNLILNPAPSVSATDSTRFINRQYANFDMLPTVLASIGCEIEGDRMSLGTNLFSDKNTIIEEYGVEYVNGELAKSSDFYNEKILN